MKRKITAFATIMVSVLLLTACGGGNKTISTNTTTTGNSSETSATSAEDVTAEKDHLLVAKSEAPFSFCTKYSDEYSYVWDSECGITIYTESEGAIPYVLVWRSFNNNITAEDIHAADKSDMNYNYGDRLISASEPKVYNLGGKELSGAVYQYEVSGYTIELLRLVDMSPSTGYVLYTAKYIADSESKAATMEALETAITYYRAGKDAYENTGSTEPFYEIVPSITETITYEHHQEAWFSMDIPSGWTVEANSFDNTAGAFIIHVYDQNDPDKQIFTTMQTLSFISEKAYTKLVNYPLAGSAFKGIPYLLGGENPLYELYQNFEVFRNSQYGKYMSLAAINDWTPIENFGQTPLGGDLIRATYHNAEGQDIQGVFSARWKNGISMYGYQYPGVFYSPMYFTAPAGEFNEWAGILSHCLSSFQYTENFVDAYMAGENATMQAFRANTEIYNSTSDMIMSSWNNRQTTYDIAAEKQSDATLGYDRIYNTETNEVYRVEVGFMDSYSGTLYQAIDDTMYTLPVVGYIYK